MPEKTKKKKKMKTKKERRRESDFKPAYLSRTHTHTYTHTFNFYCRDILFTLSFSFPVFFGLSLNFSFFSGYSVKNAGCRACTVLKRFVSLGIFFCFEEQKKKKKSWTEIRKMHLLSFHPILVPKLVTSARILQFNCQFFWKPKKYWVQPKMAEN